MVQRPTRTVPLLVENGDLLAPFHVQRPTRSVYYYIQNGDLLAPFYSTETYSHCTFIN